MWSPPMSCTQQLAVVGRPTGEGLTGLSLVGGGQAGPKLTWGKGASRVQAAGGGDGGSPRMPHQQEPEIEAES